LASSVAAAAYIVTDCTLNSALHYGIMQRTVIRSHSRSAIWTITVGPLFWNGPGRPCPVSSRDRSFWL